MLAAVGAANATVSLVGGTENHFTGYDAPPVLTDPQSSGLQDALLVSDNPLDQITATFLGKEAAHINQFFVNGGLVFNNLAAAPSTYGPFYAHSPLDFKFKDATDGSEVPNGGNALAFASYVVLGTFDTAHNFTAYHGTHGEFDFVLGFNDGRKIDADYDDLVVGLKVSVVPEPETYALMLAGLGIMGFVARRRRAD
ncbi:PEP-CTERM sorting domain-containing protein [Piscinibacter terrae]|uniref:PEP-CTERM sorting domain-containing protein n=1 Tax=Piscinibacter terrae TaxID=2496871 RepID=UPI001F1D9415|nr:PEP-CTERM sorting domain-containing protein [Albitalea terrae]